MKRSIIVDIISSVLIIFFVHTLVSTYIQLQSLKNMLAFYTLNTTGTAWAIVLSEAIISVLLFIPRTRIIGLALALLVALVTIVIIVRTPHYPHDFGGIFNNISRSQKWILIILIAVLSSSGILLTVMKKGRVSQLKTDDHPVFT